VASLLLIFYGCAVPKPTTITHAGSEVPANATLTEQKHPTGAVDEKPAPAKTEVQPPKDLSSQQNTALLELLKSKHLITDEEAALITSPTGSVAGKEQGAAASSQWTAALLELLKSKHLITDQEAALVTGQTTSGTVGEQGGAAPVEAKKSVEDVEEEIKSDVTNELYRQVWTINNALKEKDKRLRFGGDIRLRYERDNFDQNNATFAQPSNPTQLMNSTVDQNLYKYRVRFGAEADVNDTLEAVVRLSTGNTSNPVSENDNLANYENRDSVVFDLAYLRWRPSKSFTLYGGRMPNPFFSTDLLWAKDLQFDGFAVQAKVPDAASWSPFLNAGAFPLQQYTFTSRAKWLFASQAGVEKTDEKGISIKAGIAYYIFKNIAGLANPPGSTENNWTAPPFQQKGNTLFNISGTPGTYLMALASDFRELNFTGTFDIGFWDPVHVVFLGDYVKNVGFNEGDVSANTGIPNTPMQVEGYQLGMAVGNLVVDNRGQWQVYFYRKHLESDAVVDAWTDPDFHLGGTNATGWIFGSDIGVAKNTWMRLRWLTADQISGPPLAIDVLQVDLNAKF